MPTSMTLKMTRPALRLEPAASMLTLAGGEAGVVTQEGNQALHAYAAGSDGMGQAILDLFPRDAVDYSVSWHQLEGDAGMLLRGGYLFRTQGDKVSVAMMEKRREWYSETRKDVG